MDKLFKKLIIKKKYKFEKNKNQIWHKKKSNNKYKIKKKSITKNNKKN